LSIQRLIRSGTFFLGVVASSGEGGTRQGEQPSDQVQQSFCSTGTLQTRNPNATLLQEGPWRFRHDDSNH
jgi:hypothetical protein